MELDGDVGSIDVRNASACVRVAARASFAAGGALLLTLLTILWLFARWAGLIVFLVGASIAGVAIAVCVMARVRAHKSRRTAPLVIVR